METTEAKPEAKQEPRYQWFEGAFDDGGKFRFRFRHEKVGGGFRLTTCFFEHNIGIGKVLWFGYATCNPRDTFSRTIGREKSLKNVLNNHISEKPDRRAIWRCYFETRGKKMRHEKNERHKRKPPQHGARTANGKR